MDISGFSNESLFFNPTTGKSNAGFTGLSNRQIFFNPSAGRAPLDVNYSKLSDEDLVEIQGKSLTYSNKGLLFSSNGASTLQATYSLRDQYDLLSKQSSYKSMNKSMLEAYFSNFGSNSNNLDINA